MRRLKFAAIAALIFFLALGVALYLSRTVATQINSTGKVKVEEVLHRQINGTCRSIIEGDDADYVDIDQSDGNVTHIGVDVQKVNALTARCNVACTQDLEGYSCLTMEIPRGSLLGSTYWADKGRPKTFNLRVSYELATDYSTVWEAVGINQIRYAVYLVVHATAHVTVPTSVGDATYTYYVPVCETVYSSSVPNVYVADENGTNYLDLLP